MQKLFLSFFSVLVIFLCGCSDTPMGSSSIGNSEPFNQYINKPLTLVTPVKICYEERTNSWSNKTFKQGEMFYFCSESDKGEVAYEAPAGTPLIVKKVSFLPNSTDNNIIAFGEIYIRDLNKNVPFDQYWSYYSEAEHGFALLRTPWEPLDTPRKRPLKTGFLSNQYLGIKDNNRK